MLRWWKRWQATKRAKEMGMETGILVGVRMDGTIDVDIEDEEGDGWKFNNLQLDVAEFLHAELGRAIARQKERGYPKVSNVRALKSPDDSA